MSVPKKKRTSGAVGKRRSHHALKKKALNNCAQCGKAVMPHKACLFCGYYKKEASVKIKEKAIKKSE
jgi:large subunit ribosomal protein L32